MAAVGAAARGSRGAVRKSRLDASGQPADDAAVDERDMQTLMTTLFDVRADTTEILRILREEDDDDEEAEEEP